MVDVEEIGESGLVCRRKHENATVLDARNHSRLLLANEVRPEQTGIIALGAQGSPLEVLLRDSLASIGVSFLKEWQILLFVYRHGVVLTSIAQLARLLSSEGPRIGGTLDRLESRRLIEASRSSNGVRLYKVVFSDDSRRHCFQQLLSLTRDRAARLMLPKLLKLEDATAAQEVRSVTLSLKGSAE